MLCYKDVKSKHTGFIIIKFVVNSSQDDDYEYKYTKIKGPLVLVFKKLKVFPNQRYFVIICRNKVIKLKA